MKNAVYPIPGGSGRLDKKCSRSKYNSTNPHDGSQALGGVYGFLPDR